MEKANNLSYDEALAKIEDIVRSLESAEAISVAEYNEKAQQAKKLLDYCESCLKDLNKSLSDPQS